jgi:hypothetical protein
MRDQQRIYPLQAKWQQLIANVGPRIDQDRFAGCFDQNSTALPPVTQVSRVTRPPASMP